MNHPAQSARRAADTSEERTGSAFRAVGGGLASLFGATARGVGSLTRVVGGIGKTETTRRKISLMMTRRLSLVASVPLSVALRMTVLRMKLITKVGE